MRPRKLDASREQSGGDVGKEVSGTSEQWAWDFGGQSEVAEDLAHPGVLDTGDQAHAPPTARAGKHSSLDLAFICNTYHHIEYRDVYLRKLRKAPKPQGRVVIVDFYKKEGMPVGPPMHMRLSEKTVEEELQEAGLEVTESLKFLPYQYILIAQPKAESSAP